MVGGTSRADPHHVTFLSLSLAHKVQKCPWKPSVNVCPSRWEQVSVRMRWTWVSVSQSVGLARKISAVWEPRTVLHVCGRLTEHTHMSLTAVNVPRKMTSGAGSQPAASCHVRDLLNGWTFTAPAGCPPTQHSSVYIGSITMLLFFLL